MDYNVNGKEVTKKEYIAHLRSFTKAKWFCCPKQIDLIVQIEEWHSDAAFDIPLNPDTRLTDDIYTVKLEVLPIVDCLLLCQFGHMNECHFPYTCSEKESDCSRHAIQKLQEQFLVETQIEWHNTVFDFAPQYSHVASEGLSWREEDDYGAQYRAGRCADCGHRCYKIGKLNGIGFAKELCDICFNKIDPNHLNEYYCQFCTERSLNQSGNNVMYKEAVPDVVSITEDRKFSKY